MRRRGGSHGHLLLPRIVGAVDLDRRHLPGLGGGHIDDDVVHLIGDVLDGDVSAFNAALEEAVVHRILRTRASGGEGDHGLPAQVCLTGDIDGSVGSGNAGEIDPSPTRGGHKAIARLVHRHGGRVPTLAGEIEIDGAGLTSFAGIDDLEAADAAARIGSRDPRTGIDIHVAGKAADQHGIPAQPHSRRREAIGGRTPRSGFGGRSDSGQSGRSCRIRIIGNLSVGGGHLGGIPRLAIPIRAEIKNQVVTRVRHVTQTKFRPLSRLAITQAHRAIRRLAVGDGVRVTIVRTVLVISLSASRDVSLNPSIRRGRAGRSIQVRERSSDEIVPPRVRDGEQPRKAANPLNATNLSIRRTVDIPHHVDVDDRWHHLADLDGGDATPADDHRLAVLGDGRARTAANGQIPGERCGLFLGERVSSSNPLVVERVICDTTGDGEGEGIRAQRRLTLRGIAEDLAGVRIRKGCAGGALRRVRGIPCIAHAIDGEGREVHHPKRGVFAPGRNVNRVAVRRGAVDNDLIIREGDVGDRDGYGVLQIGLDQPGDRLGLGHGPHPIGGIGHAEGPQQRLLTGGAYNLGYLDFPAGTGRLTHRSPRTSTMAPTDVVPERALTPSAPEKFRLMERAGWDNTTSALAFRDVVAG